MKKHLLLFLLAVFSFVPVWSSVNIATGSGSTKNYSAVDSETGATVTVNFEKAGAGSYVQVLQNESVTVSVEEGYKIDEFQFTCNITSSYIALAGKITAGGGVYDNTTQKWTANGVETNSITIKKNAGKQSRVTSVNVTVSPLGLGAPTADYPAGNILYNTSVTFTCEKAAKMMYSVEYLDENGEYGFVVENKEVSGTTFNTGGVKQVARYTVWGVDAAGVEGKKTTAEYIPVGPTVSFNPVSGEYPIGTVITIDTDYQKSRTYEVKVNGVTLEHGKTSVSEPFTYTLERDATIEVRVMPQAGSDKGPWGNWATAEYTVPKAPVDIVWSTGDKDTDGNIIPTKAIRVIKGSSESRVYPWTSRDDEYHWLVDETSMTATSANPEIATVQIDRTEGYAVTTVTGLKRGVTTLTANYDGAGKYQPASATVPVEVFDETKQDDGNYYASILFDEQSDLEFTSTKKNVTSKGGVFAIGFKAYPATGGPEIKDGLLHMYGEKNSMLTISAPAGKMITGVTVTYNGCCVKIATPMSTVYGAKEPLVSGVQYNTAIPQSDISISTQTAESPTEANIERIDLVLVDIQAPEAPVFTVTDEEVQYLTGFKVYSKYATSLIVDLEYPDSPANSVKDKKCSSPYGFNLTENVKITVRGKNSYGETEPVSQTYKIAVPNAPTVELAPGTYPFYTTIKITTDLENPVSYNFYINGVRNDILSAPATSRDGVYELNLMGDLPNLEVSVYRGSHYSHGPESERCQAGSYYMEPLPAPKAYVNGVEIPKNAILPEGTEVTFGSNVATYVGVNEYNICGQASEEWVEGIEKKVKVDKLHRRYTAQIFNGYVITPEKMYSPVAEYFFEIEGGSYWQQVQSLDELGDGDQILIGTKTTYNDANIEGVMSNVASDDNNKRWLFAEAEFDKSESAWKLESLPENAQVITLEGTGTENVYNLKTGDNEYFYVEDASTNGLMKGEKGTPFTFTMGTSTNLGKTVSMAFGNNKSIKCYNNLIGYYANSNKAVIVLKKVAVAESSYDMTVRYSEYTGDVTGKDSGAVTLSAGAPETYEAAFVAEGNTYTAALDSDKNLCGRFTISLDGQELAGHVDDAQTDFHTGVTFGEDEEQCSADHAPYVYVQSTPTGGDSKEYNLVPSTHAQAVPLSTNPNEYHGRLVHHQNAVLTVKLNPFVSTPRLSLTSAVATGVDNVKVDGADTEAVYYDMAGRRMQGELVPGVYLEVRGSQTRKVVVR